ncbi:MAG TPA: hypothetical protein PK156_06215 [Polyangium sp.]|nr:hypothetical protein [Polyangium sp.]
MPQTIIVIDPKTRRRALLIEIHPDMQRPSPEDISAFRGRMFDRNIYAGMMVTPEIVLVELDQFNQVGFHASNYDERELRTAELFTSARVGSPRRGEQFYHQVRLWLNVIESSWFSLLQPEAIEAMVPEVVGSLHEAELSTWDHVLEADDAA